MVKVPEFSGLRVYNGPSGNCSTDAVADVVLLSVGNDQPAMLSIPSSASSVSLETAMLSLLGFLRALRRKDPILVPSTLCIPAAAKFGGDWERQWMDEVREGDRTSAGTCIVFEGKKADNR